MRKRAAFLAALGLLTPACQAWPGVEQRLQQEPVPDLRRDPCTVVTDETSTTPTGCPPLEPFRLPDGTCVAAYRLEDGVPRVYEETWPDAVLDHTCDVM